MVFGKIPTAFPSPSNADPPSPISGHLPHFSFGGVPGFTEFHWAFGVLSYTLEYSTNLRCGIERSILALVTACLYHHPTKGPLHSSDTEVPTETIDWAFFVSLLKVEIYSNDMGYSANNALR